MTTEYINGHYTQICFDICLSLDPCIPAHCRCIGYCCTLKDTHSVGLLWTVDRSVTTHNTHKRQTSVPPERFKAASPASERLQSHVLDRAVPRISGLTFRDFKIYSGTN